MDSRSLFDDARLPVGVGLAVAFAFVVVIGVIIVFAVGYSAGYESGSDDGYTEGYACGSVDWIHLIVYETEIGTYMDSDEIYQDAVEGYGVTAEECHDPFE